MLDCVSSGDRGWRIVKFERQKEGTVVITDDLNGKLGNERT